VKTIISNKFSSIKELKEIARTLLEEIKPGMVVGFSGKLGVGKTELIRQICSVLEVSDEISSPTYTLENLYQAKDFDVSHWDLYRLKGQNIEIEQQIIELKQEEKAIILVEWPDSIKHLLDIHVLLSFADLEDSDSNRREILVKKRL